VLAIENSRVAWTVCFKKTFFLFTFRVFTLSDKTNTWSVTGIINYGSRFPRSTNTRIYTHYLISTIDLRSATPNILLPNRL